MEEGKQLARSDSTLAATGLKDALRKQAAALQLSKCIPSLLCYLVSIFVHELVLPRTLYTCTAHAPQLRVHNLVPLCVCASCTHSVKKAFPPFFPLLVHTCLLYFSFPCTQQP